MILIRLQRILFSIAAGFWLMTGALAISGIVDLGFGSGDAALIVGVLMLGNGVALALAGWLSLRGHRLADFAALALVALNVVLSATDEIGVLDVVSLLVNGALLVLLIVNLRSGLDQRVPGAGGRRRGALPHQPGPDVRTGAADRFLDAYLDVADEFVYDPYWDVNSVLDICLPQPACYAPWQHFGLGAIAPHELRRRVDVYLESVMTRLI